MARGSARREIRLPTRHAFTRMIPYTLMSIEDLTTDEPRSFSEAINDSNSR